MTFRNRVRNRPIELVRFEEHIIGNMGGQDIYKLAARKRVVLSLFETVYFRNHLIAFLVDDGGG